MRALARQGTQVIAGAEHSSYGGPSPDPWRSRRRPPRRAAVTARPARPFEGTFLTSVRAAARFDMQFLCREGGPQSPSDTSGNPLRVFIPLDGFSLPHRRIAAAVRMASQAGGKTSQARGAQDGEAPLTKTQQSLVRIMLHRNGVQSANNRLCAAISARKIHDRASPAHLVAHVVAPYFSLRCSSTISRERSRTRQSMA
jgi:hypothetical protein